MTVDDDPVAPDRRLARRILEGDETAFESLFAATARGLLRFARARLGDGEVAREVVQSTYLKAAESLDRYRGEGSLAAWLQGICRFEVAAWLRRRGRQPLLSLEDEVPPGLAALDDPADVAGRRRLAGRVHDVLDALPPPYGDVLEWKYLEGFTVNEIAARLARTPKAAEMLLLRARDAFRARWSER